MKSFIKSIALLAAMVLFLKIYLVVAEHAALDRSLQKSSTTTTAKNITVATHAM